MKLVTALALATTVVALTAGSVSANGSPYSPGLVYGWPGVAPRDGAHLVSFSMPKSTIVAAVRARDGRVLRQRVVRGSFGVPLVAYDGTSGGLSGDGRTLVLGSYGPLPGQQGKTRFLLLSTRTLAPRRVLVLGGSWSFDAVSPDGRRLYLTEHLRAGDDPLYRVRPYDVASGRVLGAIVDRLEGERDMGGVPIARATSNDGRWAYTLYARRGHEPFVHALDTVRTQAYCVDLPLELGYDRQWALRLRLDPGGQVLAVTNGRADVATVSTRSWKVERTKR